jgi:hypothetical protein
MENVTFPRWYQVYNRQPEAQSKDFVTKAAKDRPAVEVSSLKGNQKPRPPSLRFGAP